MVKDSFAARIRSRLTSVCFYLLLFGYPVLSLLWRRSYPVFTAEVFRLLLVVVGMSILFSLLTEKLRPSISYLLTGLLILIVAMVQLNLLIEGLAIGAGAIALVMFTFKQRFLIFFMPVLIALIFGAYLDGRWHLLTARPEIVPDVDPTERLDVAILTRALLAPVLGIGDLRTDARIDFVGGVRGMRGLEARVDRGDAAVAFALYPTSLEEVMQVADAGKVMPPKSTWFEPKLRSGLVAQPLDGERL